jgi:hypothetical protein
MSAFPDGVNVFPGGVNVFLSGEWDSWRSEYFGRDKQSSLTSGHSHLTGFNASLRVADS